MGLIGVFGIKTGSSNFTNKSITMNLTPQRGFLFYRSTFIKKYTIKTSNLSYSIISLKPQANSFEFQSKNDICKIQVINLTCGTRETNV